MCMARRLHMFCVEDVYDGWVYYILDYRVIPKDLFISEWEDQSFKGLE